VSRQSRREYVEQVRRRYLQSSRPEKTRILDEFVAMTGLHRKSAIRALRKGYQKGPKQAPARRSMHLLEACIGVAVEAHAGQLGRDDRPYILHPLQVMLQMDTEDEMMVAVLHDALEDSGLTGQDLASLGLPEAVLEAVALLTHDREELDYESYVRRLRSNPLARKVKLADLAHNMDLRRLPDPGPADLRRLQRYRRAVEILTQ
jgi:(p)ppGpp synthase/HD superfamily hydrolase